MSQENVELAARFYECTTGKEAMLAALPKVIEQFCHPQIEWTDDPVRPDGRTYHGPEGALVALERWLESFENYKFEIERIIDCRDEVLVIGREVARGAVSGAEVSSVNHELLTFRDGKIVRFREFYDESAAFDAAGLRE